MFNGVSLIQGVCPNTTATPPYHNCKTKSNGVGVARRRLSWENAF